MDPLPSRDVDAAFPCDELYAFRYIGPMPRGRFNGRVLPDCWQVCLTDIPDLTVRRPHGDFPDVTLATHILLGQVTVDCELDPYSDDYIQYLFLRALGCARVCVDAVAFATGHGLHVIMDTFTKPNGETVPLSFSQPLVAPECTAYRLPYSSEPEREEFHKALVAIRTESALFMALNDLTETLYVPDQIPTNCGRVLDGLRKIIAPNLERKDGWTLLQGLLAVDPAYMKWISDQSTNPRHGDRTGIEGPVATEILTRTWAIMNRFIEYRKGGSRPLSPVQFPILTS